jgi:hypothetical protein
MTKKATKTVKTRPYRITKKHPKRPKVVMTMDLGRVEQQIALTFPENSKIIDVEIPKERNPNLITFRISNLKFAWYLEDKKGFIFDENGMWLGNLERHDLKIAFFKIGALLKKIKKQNG